MEEYKKKPYKKRIYKIRERILRGHTHLILNNTFLILVKTYSRTSGLLQKIRNKQSLLTTNLN